MSRAGFEEMLARQAAELPLEFRECFERYHVAPLQALLRRSEQIGAEKVFVVAKADQVVRLP
jgi:hypothetical protein